MKKAYVVRFDFSSVGLGKPCWTVWAESRDMALVKASADQFHSIDESTGMGYDPDYCDGVEVEGAWNSVNEATPKSGQDGA